jgi:aryl-alcohol dehydrogenase-like predicted oxidoreductase
VVGARDGCHRVQPDAVGLLTESFTAGRIASLAEADWRRRSPDFQSPHLGRNLRLRDALRPIAARHSASVSAIAIAWILAWPGVSGAIVGGRTPQQVDGWIEAASITLTPPDLAEVASAIRRTRAGAGPVEHGKSRARGQRAAGNSGARVARGAIERRPHRSRWTQKGI